MNCWIILDIEEYSDKKTIKVAYAKLLKVTKPDEDPEGFKELHMAYKEALALVSEYKESSAPQCFTLPKNDNKAISFEGDFFQESSEEPKSDLEGGSLKNNDNKTTNDTDQLPEQPYETPVVEGYAEHVDSNQVLENLEAAYGTPKSEIYPETKDSSEYSNNVEDDQSYLATDSFNSLEAQTKLAQDWNYLELQTKFIIERKATDSTLSDWQFLENIPSMIDLDFRSEASDRVFEIVSEINQISLEKKTLLVKEPILNYLNSFFLWDKKWQHYEETYGYQQTDAVFPYLTEEVAELQNIDEKKPAKKLYYFRRIAAYLVDLLVIYVPYLVQKYILELPSGTNMKVLIAIGAVYWFIIIPILEASPKHQASLGKKLFDIKVVNAAGNHVSLYQSFWRAIATVFCIGFFKIVLFINIYLAYKKTALLQDILSKSYVIKEPK